MVGAVVGRKRIPVQRLIEKIKMFLHGYTFPHFCAKSAEFSPRRHTQLWITQGMFLLLIPPLTFMPVIKILKRKVFYALPELNPGKAYGPDGVHPIVLKKCASVLTPFLVKLFRLCLSNSTFPSCWKFAYVQPVPKKGDRSDPSSYRSIALISCHSKAFETIFNRKFLKHLSSINLLSHHQYWFRQGRSTGDILAFLTDTWSSSLTPASVNGGYPPGNRNPTLLAPDRLINNTGSPEPDGYWIGSRQKSSGPEYLPKASPKQL